VLVAVLKYFWLMADAFIPRQFNEAKAKRRFFFQLVFGSCLAASLFVSSCATPLAAFAYLGLILLQTRWLRAELQRRRLFPAQGLVS